MFVIDFEKKERHEIFLKDASELIKSVKKVGYSRPKEEAILAPLQSMKRQAEKDESVYEKGIKTKNRVNLALAIIMISVITLTIVDILFQILPVWIAEHYGPIFIAIVLLIWLANPDKEFK